MIQYFVQQGEESKGPFSVNEMNCLNLDRKTLVWFQGLDDWQPIESIAELDTLTKKLPPALPQVSNTLADTLAAPKLKNVKQYKAKKISTIAIITAIVFVFYLLHIMPRSEINPEVDSRSEIIKMTMPEQPDFSLYVDKFYRDAAFYGLYPQRPEETTIKLAELDKIRGLTHYHGLSYGMNDDTRIEIFINARSWKAANKAERFFIIYHELAHDVFNSGHSTSSANSSRPLMNSNIDHYENLSMDDFIEAMHAYFGDEQNK